MTTVQGRLTHVNRLPSSRNGNPRFMLTLDGRHEYTTGVDSSVGYDVENQRIGSQVVLHLDDGQVYDIQAPPTPEVQAAFDLGRDRLLTILSEAGAFVGRPMRVDGRPVRDTNDTIDLAKAVVKLGLNP